MSKKIIKLPENRCDFCNKKTANNLCDKVKGSGRIFDGNGPGTVKNYIRHCDNKICEDCLTHIDGADYCPDCLKIFIKYLKGGF